MLTQCGTIVGLAICVLYIIVWVRLTRVKGLPHGLLGLVCAVYPFLWGWWVAREQNTKTIMFLWSLMITIWIQLYQISIARTGQ